MIFDLKLFSVIPKGDVLFAQFQPLDHFLVLFGHAVFEVREQFAAFADQKQQAAPAVIVFLMFFQVSCQLVDAGGDDRDLHLGGAGIFIMLGVLGDDLFLLDAFH